MSTLGYVAPATYKHTFAVLIALLFVAGAAYVVASADALRLEYLGAAVLVGCVAAIVRLMASVVLYDKSRELQVTGSGAVPLVEETAVSCPNFWLRAKHEVTGNDVCVNRFNDETLIGSPDDMQVPLSVPEDQKKWVDAFCSKLTSQTYPHVLGAKMCQYKRA